MSAVTNPASAGSRFIAWTVMAIATVSLMACGTGPVITPGQSKKDAGYSEKLQNVLVVRNLFYVGMSQANLHALVQLGEIKTAFEEKIGGPYGVRAAYADVTAFLKRPPDIVQEKAVAEAIETFHPSQILELKTSGMEGQWNLLRNYTVDATVFDTGSKKVVWRGQFLVNNLADTVLRGADWLAGSNQKEANSLMDALSVQLKNAGLL